MCAGHCYSNFPGEYEQEKKCDSFDSVTPKFNRHICAQMRPKMTSLQQGKYKTTLHYFCFLLKNKCSEMNTDISDNHY